MVMRTGRDLSLQRQPNLWGGFVYYGFVEPISLVLLKSVIVC